MTNHPNRSKLSYPAPAPVFADPEPAEHPTDAAILGQAATAAEAMALYATHFARTGVKAVKARKVCPDLRGQGPVDGWAPELADE
jgi:hypothetical protein